MQASAFAEFHVSVVELPAVIVIGSTVISTVGVVGCSTVTVTVASSLPTPPGPVQSSWYVVVTIGETDAVPFVGLEPDQPRNAVHDVAFVELHVSVVDSPAAMEFGDADRVTVGSDGDGSDSHLLGSMSARESRPPSFSWRSQRRLFTMSMMLDARDARDAADTGVGLNKNAATIRTHAIMSTNGIIDVLVPIRQ